MRRISSFCVVTISVNFGQPDIRAQNSAPFINDDVVLSYEIGIVVCHLIFFSRAGGAGPAFLFGA